MDPRVETTASIDGPSADRSSSAQHSAAITTAVHSSGETNENNGDHVVATDIEASATTIDSSDDNVGHNVSLRAIQQVELALEHVTYAPATRSAGGGGGNNGKENEGGNIVSNTLRRCFGTKMKEQRTTVLSDITSKISPGELTAWMGPSGCGKTSLVSVAAGLVEDADLIGDSTIKINGETGSLPKRLFGVVWQDDLLLSNLTIYETVRFAARLKNPSDVSDAEINALVNGTLSKLGLSHIRDRLIGVPGGSGRTRGISGGERKRVAVAVELVARPSMLLLDEPTSGLDATSAYQLMVSLNQLAKQGHSIAVVIHQPRTSIFNMFDNLLLLSKGKVIYDGPPMGAREFLESCPGVDPLPPETGKADWIMDVINEDEKREEGGTLPSLWKEFCSKKMQQSSSAQNNGLRHRHIASTTSSATSARGIQKRLSTLQELETLEPKFHTTFWLQLRLLSVRAQRQQRGNRLTRVALLMTVSWTLFICLSWGHLPDTTTYIYNRSSLLFFLIIAQSNSVVNSTLLIFSKERRLLSRERAKKMYGVLPYFIAMTLSDMINSVLLPLMTGIVVYLVCNFQRTVEQFFIFVATMYLTVSAAQSTGLFLSVLIPNTSIALLLAPLLTICLMIIGGFYMPLDLIHPALRWASWLSMARYGFSAFMSNEFVGRSVPCGDSDDECPLEGIDILSSYGIEGVWASIWPNICMLIAIQVFLRGATYILLRRSKFD